MDGLFGQLLSARHDADNWRLMTGVHYDTELRKFITLGDKQDCSLYPDGHRYLDLCKIAAQNGVRNQGITSLSYLKNVSILVVLGQIGRLPLQKSKGKYGLLFCPPRYARWAR